MNLDRFAEGRPDLQNAPVLAYCSISGAEIYQGQTVYIVNGKVVHAAEVTEMTIEEAVEMGYVPCLR